MNSTMFFVLLALLFTYVQATTRTYYMQAEPTEWDYAPFQQN